MEPLDNLREWVCDYYPDDDARYCELHKIADAIEAEIARDYMELPKDADGEPIHVGDRMENTECGVVTVDAVSPDGFAAYKQNGFAMYTPCVAGKGFKHHCPPIVEGLLEEFAQKITDSQVPGSRPAYDEIIAKYATKLELREEA